MRHRNASPRLFIGVASSYPRVMFSTTDVVHRMARRLATVRGPGPFVSKMPRGAVECMSVMLRESRSRSTTDSDLVVCKQEGD